MYKKEFITRVTEVLREKDARKKARTKSHVFRISDEDGNASSFAVKSKDVGYLFNAGDVEAIVNACMEVLKENIRNGETTCIQGFGNLHIHKRAERYFYKSDGEKVIVPERLVPKFNYGSELRNAARMYQLSLGDKAFVPDDEVDDDGCD